MKSEAKRRRQRTDARARDDQYRRYVESAPDGIFVTDRSGRYVEVNRAACEMTGYCREELLARSIVDIVPPGNEEVAGRAFASLAETGRSYGEFPFVRKDGELRSMSVNAVKLDDDTFVAFCNDITDRVATEEALRSTQEHLKRAQAQAHVGSWEWDLTTNRRTWSEELYRILGVAPDTLAAEAYETFLELLHPEDRERVDEAVRRCIECRESLDTEYRCVRPDGRVLHIHARADLFIDSRGEPTKMIGVSQDITERKLAQEALRESEAKFRALFENKTVLAYVTDIEGAILLANEAGASFMGETKESIVGRSFFSLRPDRAELYQDVIDRIAATGEPMEFETVFPFEEEDKTLYVTVSPVEVAGSLNLQIVTQDITEHKRATELEGYARGLVDAQEAERRRIARELHDGVAQLLVTAKILLGTSQSARDETRTAREILGRALDEIDAITKGLRSPLLEAFGLDTALKRLCVEAAHSGGFSLDQDIEAVRAPIAIQDACFRIAQETLSNICKHAEASSVEVSLRQEDDVIVLDIRDDGRGFCSDVRYPGAGLSNMRLRAKTFSGTCTIASSPGHGTRVGVRIPTAVSVEGCVQEASTVPIEE